MKETIQKNLVPILLGGILLVLVWESSISGSVVDNFGSIQDGHAYNSTSTAPIFIPSKLLKNGAGTLGSVVITGANTGDIQLYDATTTDITKRTNNTATSSIILASIPASTAAGTYTFDVEFSIGLLADISASIPTTTITWR